MWNLLEVGLSRSCTAKLKTVRIVYSIFKMYQDFVLFFQTGGFFCPVYFIVSVDGAIPMLDLIPPTSSARSLQTCSTRCRSAPAPASHPPGAALSGRAPSRDQCAPAAETAENPGVRRNSPVPAEHSHRHIMLHISALTCALTASVRIVASIPSVTLP